MGKKHFAGTRHAASIICLTEGEIRSKLGGGWKHREVGKSINQRSKGLSGPYLGKTVFGGAAKEGGREGLAIVQEQTRRDTKKKGGAYQ